MFDRYKLDSSQNYAATSIRMLVPLKLSQMSSDFPNNI